MKMLVRNKALYEEPKGGTPPPFWIRALLICAGVSVAHGSNDGQKGMGLIMLILIGTVPTAYALNKAVPQQCIADFRASSDAAVNVVEAHAAGAPASQDTAKAVATCIEQKTLQPDTFPAVAVLIGEAP